ncbi:ATP-binding cassette domain-containing protein [Paenibacillus sp. IB182496]|uniref:ATP-binding cassette domain-containing protein n=1 Tax=Paenibacillus sabuli TaxID=2772509 RepID=A0A927BUI7_9BACL|nr:ATP-binding cassette domain-containing protein [Paenibacillus sabuli]MBD2847078.1 ATP-binding cassette domain-containing protein [Paenibacillus sabuli]
MNDSERDNSTAGREGTAASAAPCLLETRGLTKRFGALVASRAIDLQVRAGEIHAILGENGAGKSTLMKMLYGVYVPDEGELRMDGELAVLHPPAKARARGIGMVFQDFRLVPAMTVLDNIALSSSEGGWRMRRKALHRRILDVSAKYGLSVDPEAEVWQLDLGQRQRLEIVKVLLAHGTRIIIFDEPTSVLVPQEVVAFLEMLRRLRADGYGILLITHKIDEVMACADRATVLRSGAVTYAATREEGGLERESLIRAMMGDKELRAVVKARRGPGTEGVAAVIEAGAEASDVANGGEAPGRTRADHGSAALSPIGKTMLAVKGGLIRGNHGEVVLRELELELPRGAITGVAGISGNGQRELAETLFGLRELAGGTLTVGGRRLRGGVRAFMDAGVSFVSEDPLKESVIPGFSILEHMVLDGLAPQPKGTGIDWKAARTELDASEAAAALALASAERRADTLSGGNVQRMVLTRALLRRPDILIISYPSRGLDIGTTRTIQQQLVALAEQGTAVLLFSEDLGELFKLSDRLVVLAGQRLLGPYAPEDTDVRQIGERMLKGESA